MIILVLKTLRISTNSLSKASNLTPLLILITVVNELVLLIVNQIEAILDLKILVRAILNLEILVKTILGSKILSNLILVLVVNTYLSNNLKILLNNKLSILLSSIVIVKNLKTSTIKQLISSLETQSILTLLVKRRLSSIQLVVLKVYLLRILSIVQTYLIRVKIYLRISQTSFNIFIISILSIINTLSTFINIETFIKTIISSLKSSIVTLNASLDSQKLISILNFIIYFRSLIETSRIVFLTIVMRVSIS